MGIENDDAHLICKDSGQAVAFSELMLHLEISVTMSLRAVGEILVLLLLSKKKRDTSRFKCYGG